jgi:hypothetical protein
VTQYSTFLTITDPAGVSKILNVVTFQEEEMQWIGEEGKAFAGNWISTQRDAKRLYTTTVEFLTPLEVEVFRNFVSTIDVVTGRVTGPKTVFMSSGIDGARRGGALISVQIILGRMEPHDYQLPTGVTQSWTVDLTIREV